METKIAFLFDLDGVLIDSETIYTEIWNEIDRRYPTGIKDFARVIKGSTLERILELYFPDKTIRAKVEDCLYKLESQIRYKMTDGARELLEFLKDNDYTTALVTSSNEIKMTHLYQQMPDFKSHFDFIVTGDMVNHSKPDPEGYALAASRLGVAPENCVVVEDSLQGVKAGEALGGKVIGVAGTLPAETIAPHSTIVIGSLRELTPSTISKLLDI